MHRPWRILRGRSKPNWPACTSNCGTGRIVRNRFGGFGSPSPAVEQRPLGIPAVRDRTVQAALRHVLEPIFEAEFAEHSYG